MWQIKYSIELEKTIIFIPLNPDPVQGGGEGKPGIGNPEWVVCVCDLTLLSLLLSPLAAGKLQPHPDPDLRSLFHGSWYGMDVTFLGTKLQ